MNAVNAVPAKTCGQTAPRAAPGGGHAALVKPLIDYGADLHARPAPIDGKPALEAALEGGHDDNDIVKLLKDSGTRPWLRRQRKQEDGA